MKNKRNREEVQIAEEMKELVDRGCEYFWNNPTRSWRKIIKSKKSKLFLEILSKELIIMDKAQKNYTKYHETTY